MPKIVRRLIISVILVGLAYLLINAASKKVTVIAAKADNLYQKFAGEKIALDNNIKHVKGDFGELELRENIIQATKSFVQNQTDLNDVYNTFSSSSKWNFTGVTISRIREIFINAGLDKETCRTLLKETLQNKARNGYVTIPDKYTKWKLPKQVRSNLYKAIGYYDENFMYSEPLIFNSSNADEWFIKSNLSSSLKKRILSLVYVRNNLCYLSDTDLILGYIKNDDEFLSLIQTLYRVKTVDVYLIIHRRQDISKLTAYWGNMGRTKKVSEVLKDAVSNNVISEVNISNLLPTIPQSRLETYSGVSEYKEQFKDCHWTTLNFFNNSIDNNYYNLKDINEFISYISKPISNNQLRFGDIVSIFNKNKLVHSCTYIADGLVLTKDGMGTLMPFVITYMDTTVSMYGKNVAYSKRTVSDTNTLKNMNRF